MKVLLTADPIGGVWTYALELCRALSPWQVQVALATLGRPLTAAQRGQVIALGNVTLYESAFRLEWMPDPWEDLARAGDWLLKLETQFNPDIVHLNHLVHADLPWRAPVITVGHSCVLSWWEAVRGGRAGLAWSTYERRVRESLQAAHCVVAPTQAMLGALGRYYGPFRDAVVIHNGRSADSFSSGRKQRLVLCAGRLWDEAKNVGALASSAADINAPVVLAGESRGPHGNAAATQGLEVLGHLEAGQLASWYAKAAVYCLPARYEPFGLTALEAGLSGCALVLGDIDSLREVWGAAALYVEPQDHAALRKALNELLANDLSRASMARRALARARELTAARMGRQYFRLYGQLRCDSHCSITP